MRKKSNYNDLVSEWPSAIREGIKITDHDLGILEVSIHGETEITPQMLEEMKEKFGYMCQRINIYPCIPKFLEGHLDIQNEDDLSHFLVTSITFREYQAPPLENDGESDREVL